MPLSVWARRSRRAMSRRMLRKGLDLSACDGPCAPESALRECDDGPRSRQPTTTPLMKHASPNASRRALVPPPIGGRLPPTSPRGGPRDLSTDRLHEDEGDQDGGVETDKSDGGWTGVHAGLASELHQVSQSISGSLAPTAHGIGLCFLRMLRVPMSKSAYPVVLTTSSAESRFLPVVICRLAAPQGEPVDGSMPSSTPMQRWRANR